jgi:hypothetical protein
MQKFFVTVLCALALAAQGRAQTLTQGTIDAAKLSAVTPLDAAWRFYAGDDASWAGPRFDDSAWPLLKPDQPLAEAHLPNVPGGYVWARLRLHIVDPAVPLGISMVTNAQLPYQVYANGKLIYTSPSFAARQRRVTSDTAIALPQSPELLLAVRVFVPAPFTLHYLPINRVAVGPLQALTDAAELERLHTIDEYTIAGVLDALLFLALAPIPLTLYLFQRGHREYLALAVFASVFGGYYLLDSALSTGVLPLTRATALLFEYAGWLSMLAALEFIARFAVVEDFRLIRVFQALLLLGPVISLFSDKAYQYATLSGIAILFGAGTFSLIRAWRRGRTELTLLIPPVVIWAGIILYTYSAQNWPKVLPWPARFHMGPVGISIDHVGSAIFISGVIAVVLYRFIRVSRDEQRAASELEAARTVQHVLIPEARPNIPGLKILSAYHPAQSVGGDFFQILPVADGACLIVLGDVAGKGLQAAMAVSVLVGAIRALAGFTTSPAEMLAELNRLLFGRQSSFTTCLALHIAANGQVTAANAGHLHPYLNGQELALEPNLPLGFAAPDDPASAYVETHFFLGPDDTLTLLTDGVPEAANPHTHELFGFHRTQNISAQTPQTIANTAQAFGQNDDITVLSLSRVAG